MPDFVSRLVLAAGLIAVGWLLFRLANSAVLARASRAAGRQKPGERLFQPGRTGILYFTTADCVSCKTFQRPQLRRLEDMLGEQVEVVEVDAGEQPDLASRWGVLSVPTTFIVDASGEPRHVNHGAVSAEKLAKQVQALNQS
jgi:thiol-disulfide isomerase/thioredoxin